MTRVDELLESLEALITDLTDAGCYVVVSVLEPDLISIHTWRTTNALIAYALADRIASEAHSELTQD